MFVLSIILYDMAGQIQFLPKEQSRGPFSIHSPTCIKTNKQTNNPPGQACTQASWYSYFFSLPTVLVQNSYWHWFAQKRDILITMLCGNQLKWCGPHAHALKWLPYTADTKCCVKLLALILKFWSNQRQLDLAVFEQPRSSQQVLPKSL